MTAYPAPQPAAFPPPGPVTPPRRSRVGRVLIVIGAVILLLAIFVGAVLAIVGIGGVAKGAADGTVMESGQGVIDLDAGEEMTLYYDDSAGMPTCMVLDPDGEAVQPGGIQTSELTFDGTTWTSLENFTPATSGEHVIACDHGPVMVAPPVSIGGIFAGVGGILIGVFGGGLGMLLVIVGIVVHVATKPKP